MVHQRHSANQGQLRQAFLCPLSWASDGSRGGWQCCYCISTCVCPLSWASDGSRGVWPYYYFISTFLCPLSWASDGSNAVQIGTVQLVKFSMLAELGVGWFLRFGSSSGPLCPLSWALDGSTERAG